MTVRNFPTAARLALAALVLHLVLVQPNHPAAATWEALLLFPLELPVILLGLAALGPGRAGLAARAVLVAALVVIAVLKTADFAAFSALSRGFNPVADLPLVEASVRLLAGTVGGLAAAGIVVAALAAVGLLAAALWWATGVWSRAGLPPVARRAAGLVAVLAAGVATAEIADALRAWKSPVAIPGAAFTARVGIERVDMAARTFADLRVFRAAAAADPLAGQTGLLDAIDRDVIVIFVESYGRTSIDTPYYAEVHRATLEESAERLGQLGLAMRSGFALAPTRGGQSWLSHATLMNGLWIDDQARYGAALASGRETLFHIAARSGFRTAAVMPAITLEWPESAFMGFETVLAAADLGYRGKPFNWVTMPDQFTLAALDRLLRSGGDERPLFAQVALVSSHAPWVPVPTLLDWDALGDGRVFDEVRSARRRLARPRPGPGAVPPCRRLRAPDRVRLRRAPCGGPAAPPHRRGPPGRGLRRARRTAGRPRPSRRAPRPRRARRRLGLVGRSRPLARDRALPDGRPASGTRRTGARRCGFWRGRSPHGSSPRSRRSRSRRCCRRSGGG